MQRVYSKQCRHECTAPHRVTYLMQQPKEQQSISDVQNDIGHVVWSGIQAVHLDIEHVRKPRKRVPVRRMARREGPPDAIPRQSRSDVRILRYVFGIVIVQKIVISEGG